MTNLSYTVSGKKKEDSSEIRNKGRDVPIDIMEIQRLIRDYYEQLYTKLDNPEEMDKILKHVTYWEWIKQNRNSE